MHKRRHCENCTYLRKAKEGRYTKHDKRRVIKNYFICEFDDSRMEQPHGRCKDWKGVKYKR